MQVAQRIYLCVSEIHIDIRDVCVVYREKAILNVDLVRHQISNVHDG